MIISLLSCITSFFVVFMLAVCTAVNIFPVCDMIYKGTRGITPYILNLGDRWKGVVNFMPWSLHQWERTLVPTEHKAG